MLMLFVGLRSYTGGPVEFRLFLLGCEEDNADDKTSGDNERVRLSSKKRLDIVLSFLERSLSSTLD